MKQYNLFGSEEPKKEQKYSSSIEAPIYEPKNAKPNILQLCNDTKCIRLITQIRNSNVSDEEKAFLIKAEQRHIVFNYEKIADYYAHSDSEMQNLMERSGLVIIDFHKAIQYGYVKVCEEIRNQYLEEYEQ